MAYKTKWEYTTGRHRQNSTKCNYVGLSTVGEVARVAIFAPIVSRVEKKETKYIKIQNSTTVKKINPVEIWLLAAFPRYCAWRVKNTYFTDDGRLY